MTFEEYVRAWSGLHGGFDPTGSRIVRGWTRTAYGIGSWLARKRVGPTGVTTAGLILCAAAPGVALLGRAGVAGAALLVLLAVVADGLDGAVAVLTGRASPLGYVIDSVADRLGEIGWLAALWVAGAPAWLVVAAGATSWLQEYARARATGAGMTEIGVVTVAERPTRALIALFGLLAAAVLPVAAEVAAGVWLTATVVALGQLSMAIRRALA